jgi:tetratricopeptide (TPR) repeat protein
MVENLCKQPHASPITAEAIRRYDEAIAGAPQDAPLLGNRSAAYLALGLYREAEEDARHSTELDPTWAKGHFR